MTDKCTEWVKVKDRMPRKGQRVLLFLDSGHIMDAYCNPKFAGGFSSYRNGGQCITGAKEWIPYPK